jgi:hypothetical protein
MTGSFGQTNSDDGCIARTQASGKNGIFAGNDSTDAGTVPGGGNGVFGRTTVPNASGVFGANDGTGGGPGVSGFSAKGDGVDGRTQSSGKNDMFAGNDATNANTVPGGGNGVFGRTTVPNASGVFGTNDSGSADGVGVAGLSASGIGIVGQGGKLAGKFVGNVEIAGDLTILNGKDIHLADFAEDFDVSGFDEIESGSVVVLDDEGSVQQSRAAYDHKVAGVVSGAGNFRSAITLDRHESQGMRKAIALMGKVYCKVDAQYSAIAVGDLLTTSATPGHAMKAIDPLKAFGSVIGKALCPLNAGQGMIPILIALQ